jgi:predicted RNase H-like HicB family nuclease
MDFELELEREEDGRWIAEIPSLPGVLAYGNTQSQAIERVKELAYTYCQDNGYFIGHLNDFPDYDTQGRSLPELESMLRSLQADIINLKVKSLEAGYKAMAEDKLHEAEAVEWIEGNLGNTWDD